MRLSVLLAILPLAIAAPNAVKRDAPALLIKAQSGAEVIADNYIVKLRDGSALAAVEGAMSLLAVPAEAVYKNVFYGFAGALDAETLEMLRNHPDVGFLILSQPDKAKSSHELG